MNTPDWSLAEDDPRAFFGLVADATLTDLKRAYARLIKTWKPDKFPSEFKKVRRAFEELEHEFKLEAPPIDLDQAHFLRSPEAAAAASESETPTRLRPDFPSAPSLDWTARLHEIGVETTLAEMEKLGRLEPRDWLLLAALREAQNPDDRSIFIRSVIEAIHHHMDSLEIWQALLVEIPRYWYAEEIERISEDLITLHHHPDFLRRCHGFWMHAFEVAPAANLCPLLDRFLHRAHGKAHQEEASFVMEILVRFAPALPPEWIRLQTSFYEQIWGPTMKNFAADLNRLPAILNVLKKSADPAARRLLDFFAAWGRHDLQELHLCRLELRQLLIQRPDSAKPLLPHAELFLPACRLLSFRSRNLRGEGKTGSPLTSSSVMLWTRTKFSNMLDREIHQLPIFAVIISFLTSIFIVGQIMSLADRFAPMTCFILILMTWFYLAYLSYKRMRELFHAMIWPKSALMLAYYLGMIGLIFTGVGIILALIVHKLLSSHKRWLLWAGNTDPERSSLALAIANFVLIILTANCFNLSDGHQSLNWVVLVLQFLLIMILKIGPYTEWLYKNLSCRWYHWRLRSLKRQLIWLISHSEMNLYSWFKALDAHQPVARRLFGPAETGHLPHLHHFGQAFLSNGDNHLAAAIWEAPRNRGED